MNVIITIQRLRLPIALILLFVLACTACKQEKTEAVNIRLEGAPNNLNGYLTNVAYSLYVCNQVYQTLGNLDPKTLEMKPLLLKNIPSVRNVQDGPHQGALAYDFEIMEQAAWDNGSPLTAEDVVFSLKIIFHPDLPTQNWASFFEFLQAVEVDPNNPKKFSVYFKQYYMLSLESLCQFFIYPAYHYDPAGQLRNIPLSDFLDKDKIKQRSETEPALKAFAAEFTQPKFSNEPSAVSGSGPYRVESLSDQSCVLVKKANWWGDAAAAQNPLLAAYPEKLVYKVVKDEAVVENMLKTNELDIVTNVSAAKFLELKGNGNLQAQYDFATMGSIQYGRLVFNLRNPKLSDLRVRQAVAQVIDYDYIIKTALQNLAERISSPINPAKNYYAKDLAPYQMNLQTAKNLLNEAGWADSDNNGVLDKTLNGTKTELTLDLMAPTTSKVNEMLANSLKETARQAGIQINIVAVDISRLSTETKAGNFEMALLGTQLFPGLVELYPRFHSASLPPAGNNTSGFADPLADSLIVAIRTTPDESLRNALYQKVQRRLYEQLPEVPLYAPYQRIIVAKKFDYQLSANRPGYYEQMFKSK
jgi:peptide/nickel transport system substrate-binding protein